jgi:uncharacterized membrane protein YqjE
MTHTLRQLDLVSIGSKRVARRALAIAENRLELLTVEVREEGERLLHAVLLALALAAFGLLAGITLTIATVLLFWEHRPVVALLVLLVVYAGGAAWMYARLNRLRREWQTLPATLDQLKKDRQCLENCLR